MDFHAAGLRAMANALRRRRPARRAGAADIPTLLLYGDADRRSPVRIGQDLQAQIPGSRLVVFPGSGHMVNLEESERFNDEVRGFLSPDQDELVLAPRRHPVACHVQRNG
jgi:pimeloyl-ACP methyl ester carboxylesterase